MRVLLLLITLEIFCASIKAQRADEFRAGFKDTFSIHGTRFRVLYKKKYEEKNEPMPLVLEKYNSKWSEIDFFYARGLNYWRYDLNKDGYDDFVVDNRWQYLFYLYNPAKKTFDKCGYFPDGDSDSLHIVSEKNKLYFDRWQNKFENWWSYLYTIKNNIRYNLGIIEYKFTRVYSSAPQAAITGQHISVRKIYGDAQQKQLWEIKNVDFDKFDIKKFWQENLQKFYPNALMQPAYNMGELYSPEEQTTRK